MGGEKKDEGDFNGKESRGEDWGAENDQGFSWVRRQLCLHE